MTRKRRMNKKGVFFTILVIVLLSFFFISYTMYSSVKDREVINKRITTMNNFIFSLEKDMSRQLYITGFRIIFLLEKKIIDTGHPISNFNSTFEECFFNGTIYGQSQELMNGATFRGILDSINERAAMINLEISLSPHKLSVSQKDPWRVEVSFETGMLIRDKGNLAFWNKTETIVAYIPVENFEDPLYIINTDGRITNRINKTIYKPFAHEGNVYNLSLHSQGSFYTESSSAPSFLDRLEGKKTANPNGIESLVYLPKISTQGIPVKDKTCVDYIYFSDNNPPSSCGIQGMPSWFKLDIGHLGTYNVVCQG